MDNGSIIIQLNMFDMNSRIFYSDGENEAEPLGECLLQDVPQFALHELHERGCSDIKIVGGGKFSPLIEYTLQQQNELYYSNSFINIEVI